jgi:hypothetical protein
MKNNFKVGDVVMSETLHNVYFTHNVIRCTRTLAILDNGERLPIEGVNGCRHKKTYSNKHMVHYQTYYRLPNESILIRMRKHSERYGVYKQTK